MTQNQYLYAIINIIKKNLQFFDNLGIIVKHEVFDSNSASFKIHRFALSKHFVLTN